MMKLYKDKNNDAKFVFSSIIEEKIRAIGYVKQFIGKLKKEKNKMQLEMDKLEKYIEENAEENIELNDKLVEKNRENQNLMRERDDLIQKLKDIDKLKAKESEQEQ